MRSQKDKDLNEHWKQEIKAGKVYRKRHGRHQDWKEYRKYYRGDWKDRIVPVNRTFSYGRSMLPRVYFRAPRVSVTPRHPRFKWQAKVIEAVDNWLIQETLLKLTLKRSALQSFLCGVGPIKLGFDSEFGYIPDQAIDRDSSTATQYSRKSGENIEYNVGVKPGMPWALPVLADDVVVPYGYQWAESLPWVAHRIIRPLDDIKEDQKYKNTKNLSGTRMSDIYESRPKVDLPERDDDIRYGELYEIREKRENKIITICEDEVLLEDVDALQVEGLPWEFTIFNEDPEYFWGIPDARMIEPQQLELNEARTQAQRHRKIALIKFLYLSGKISEDQLENFLSGEVGPAVAVEGESIDSVISVMQPHVPPDFDMQARVLSTDMAETLGYSPNELASYRQGTPPTATEASRVGGAHDIRDDERRDIMKDVFINIIRKWNQYVFQFWDQERVIQIAGPDGAQHWVQYTGDQLIGEYDYLVDMDAALPITKSLRHEVANAVFDKYNGDQMINQIELRRMHLQQFEWVFPGISSLLNTEMPPEEAALAGLERQPHPGGPGMKGNRGGGRTPDKPMPVEKLASGGSE